MSKTLSNPGPVHEHDCDLCEYITTYPLRHPHYDRYDPTENGPWITHADVWRCCDGSFNEYIVRYGAMGEYATTNDPGVYVLAPFVSGEDRF